MHAPPPSSTPGEPCRPGVSVVVPVYNNADGVRPLYERVRSVLDAADRAWEIIFVDDGSRDLSWNAIRNLATEDPKRVRGLRMMRNYGQHNALLAGIRNAGFDVTVTIDDDLQHPPEEIPKLLAHFAEGFDVVYGPPEQEQHGWLRDLASLITKFSLQSAIGAETARMASAFRVFRTSLRESFAAYNSPFVSIDVLLTWGAARFSAQRVRHDPRRHGQSNYTVGQLVRHAVNMMTGFSVRPLQFASVIGFFFTLFGLGVLAYVVINFFVADGRVAGFAFLASIIAIFSGAQLFALGIMGEYLARMHFRTMDKPAYTVRERSGGDSTTV